MVFFCHKKESLLNLENINFELRIVLLIDFATSYSHIFSFQLSLQKAEKEKEKGEKEEKKVKKEEKKEEKKEGKVDENEEDVSSTPKKKSPM